MSNQETSNETTSISQLSISEPISTNLVGSIITSKNSLESTTTSINSNNSLDLKKSPNRSKTTNQQNSTTANLDLSFSNCFITNIPDSSASVCEPRVDTPVQQMNGLSISELCFLFCCPPIPSTIAAKLAFLPPEPSYSFSSISANGTANLTSSLNSTDTTNVSPPMPPPLLSNQNYIEAKLNLTTRAEWQYTSKELSKIEVCWSRTSKNNRIACMYIKAVANPKFVILFSHGNAIDLGQMSSFYLSLGTRINCNIFSYDYSGYGVSTGRPSERNLYADIDCAWNTLKNKYNFSNKEIILYGQSIGTVSHSPLMSGFRIFTQTKRTWFFDSFPTIDKIAKVTSPVLVIHGSDDEVIDISHGLAIYERCVRPVEPLWVEGAGHNDVELYSQYLERLRHFINNDLPAN